MKKTLVMRTKTYAILIFCLLFSNTWLIAQKYARNQFVVFSYTVDVDERVKTELARYENLIQYNPTKKQSKVEAMLVHSLYQILTQTLSDSLIIYFLPPNNMGNKASYNVYGYPNIVIQKAIRLSDVKYFIKIDATIENSKYDEKGKKLTPDIFLPIITISVEIYNKFGFNPIQTAEGEAVATTPIKISESFIAGLNFVSPEIKATSKEETMRQLMERCALNVLYSIKNRKIK